MVAARSATISSQMPTNTRYSSSPRAPLKLPDEGTWTRYREEEDFTHIEARNFLLLPG
jgi:hypothetical protein